MTSVDREELATLARYLAAREIDAAVAECERRASAYARLELTLAVGAHASDSDSSVEVR